MSFFHVKNMFYAFQRKIIFGIVTLALAIGGGVLLLKEFAKPREAFAPSGPQTYFDEKGEELVQSREQQGQEIAIKKIYSKRSVNGKPIVLTKNDVLEIADTHYILKNNITLRDNAKLIVRNSLFEHQKDSSLQYGLNAEGNAEVIVENSEIGTNCTGSLHWNFFGNSSLRTNNVTQKDCSIWHVITDNANAAINDHPFKGTVCDNGNVAIENGKKMEIELCVPEGSQVDESLPADAKDLVFPNENEKNVDFKLRVKNSTVDKWRVSVLPKSDITIRDAPALIISIMAGIPWDFRTVVLEGLERKFYEDRVWEIGDAKLRLVNTKAYGWELNVFGTNILIIKDSDLTSASVNSGTARYVIENSKVGFIRAQDKVEIILRNSTVSGDAVAKDNGKVTLVNTAVLGKTIEEGNGKVIVSD